MKRPVIFLIPFAGGSVYSFMGLEKELRNADIVSLELPGRGQRIHEELSTDHQFLLNDLFNKVRSKVSSHQPYFIFGHSLGTLFGYLIIHKMIEHGGPLPAYFFVSGRGGPSIPEKHVFHELPQATFREKLRELGGTPTEVLQNEDLMDFLEPVLRADFALSATYLHEKKQPFNVPITGFYGAEEETTIEEMLSWNEETTTEVAMIEFPGDHFFIFNEWKQIGRIINAKITSTITAS